MILIVSQNKSKAVAVSDIFHYMLILSYPCVPKDALREISTVYKAILVVDPEDLPDSKDFIKKMRALADIPIFAISEDPKSMPNTEYFDKAYKNAILSSTLVVNIIEYLKQENRPCVGEYRLAGIDTSFYLKTPTFYFHDVNLTKTERMIMNYLIVTYPLKQSNTNIVKYAFRSGKKPEDASIRTHISHIKNKFRKINERDIIENIPGKGYYILTPEIVYKVAKIL